MVKQVKKQMVRSTMKLPRYKKACDLLHDMKQRLLFIRIRRTLTLKNLFFNQMLMDMLVKDVIPHKGTIKKHAEYTWSADGTIHWLTDYSQTNHAERIMARIISFLRTKPIALKKLKLRRGFTLEQLLSKLHNLHEVMFERHHNYKEALKSCYNEEEGVTYMRKCYAKWLSNFQ
jgi:hypothetical protein